LIGLNEDVVNVPDENFLLVENRFESNEYDEKSSRTMASHKQCVVCKQKERMKLRKLNDEAALDAYLKTNIFIPFGCRA
jgi:hypothetical protein